MQVAVDFRHGVAGKDFLGVWDGPQPEPHQMVLGFAGGNETADVLEKYFGPGKNHWRHRMQDAVQAFVLEADRSRGCVGEVGGERHGHGGRRGQPKRVVAQRRFQTGHIMLRELAGEGMHDKPRVTRREVADDFRILFLIATDGAHRGQAARHGVRAGRDALAEGQRLETGGIHGLATLTGQRSDDKNGIRHMTRKDGGDFCGRKAENSLRPAGEWSNWPQ